ncbi:hypothetical protein COBT_000646, partial [Conglomerata obtusa]
MSIGWYLYSNKTHIYNSNTINNIKKSIRVSPKKIDIVKTKIQKCTSQSKNRIKAKNFKTGDGQESGFNNEIVKVNTIMVDDQNTTYLQSKSSLNTFKNILVSTTILPEHNSIITYKNQPIFDISENKDIVSNITLVKISMLDGENKSITNSKAENEQYKIGMDHDIICEENGEDMTDKVLPNLFEKLFDMDDVALPDDKIEVDLATLNEKKTSVSCFSEEYNPGPNINDVISADKNKEILVAHDQNHFELQGELDIFHHNNNSNLETNIATMTNQQNENVENVIKDEKEICKRNISEHLSLDAVNTPIPENKNNSDNYLMIQKEQFDYDELRKKIYDIKSEALKLQRVLNEDIQKPKKIGFIKLGEKQDKFKFTYDNRLYGSLYDNINDLICEFKIITEYLNSTVNSKQRGSNVNSNSNFKKAFEEFQSNFNELNKSKDYKKGAFNKYHAIYEKLKLAFDSLKNDFFNDTVIDNQNNINKIIFKIEMQLLKTFIAFRLAAEYIENTRTKIVVYASTKENYDTNLEPVINGKGSFESEPRTDSNAILCMESDDTIFSNVLPNMDHVDKNFDLSFKASNPFSYKSNKADGDSSENEARYEHSGTPRSQSIHNFVNYEFDSTNDIADILSFEIMSSSIINESNEVLPNKIDISNNYLADKISDLDVDLQIDEYQTDLISVKENSDLKLNDLIENECNSSTEKIQSRDETNEINVENKYDYNKNIIQSFDVEKYNECNATNTILNTNSNIVEDKTNLCGLINEKTSESNFIDDSIMKNTNKTIQTVLNINIITHASGVLKDIETTANNNNVEFKQLDKDTRTFLSLCKIHYNLFLDDNYLTDNVRNNIKSGNIYCHKSVYNSEVEINSIKHKQLLAVFLLTKEYNKNDYTEENIKEIIFPSSQDYLTYRTACLYDNQKQCCGHTKM